MDLMGKVALVTGGARGLGRTFTEALLAQRAKVCFCDVNETLGSKTLQELQSKYGDRNVMFQVCDVTKQQQMENLFQSVKEKLGCLDIVCNNAGIGGETHPLWEKAVDVNLKGSTRGTLLALDHMRTDRGGNGGVIVNVSSAAGLNVNPLCPVYSATKAAIIALTRSLAMNTDVKSAGVRLNVLCPAFVDTDLVKEMNDDNCLDVTKAHHFIDVIGVMTKEETAESFMELVCDINQNGAVLKCSKIDGKQYTSIEVKPIT
ncbi:15-hydroxyprostaglandin dehydrogenase [NAD(+)]-like [Ostrea edulis]|uniref:15-hydroxyprostaglandin dehydrogenase [NAD(+)]-like n=1 Tax=Ostrea edulis TaxID=37623 RepID=UPI0020945BA1|nr:15-hydroxyprostaglandin dehydrogenase [NAD(+)]-like [Ostrea edulis]